MSDKDSIEERIAKLRKTFDIQAQAKQAAQEDSLIRLKELLKPVTDILDNLATVNLPSGFTFHYEITAAKDNLLTFYFENPEREPLKLTSGFYKYKTMVSIYVTGSSNDLALYIAQDDTKILKPSNAPHYKLSSPEDMQHLADKLESWFVTIVASDFAPEKINPTVKEVVTIRSIPSTPEDPSQG